MRATFRLLSTPSQGRPRGGLLQLFYPYGCKTGAGFGTVTLLSANPGHP